MLGRGGRASARSGPRWWRWTASALCVSLAVVLIDLWVGGDSGPYTLTPQMIVAFNLYQVLGVGLAIWAWRHRHLDRRSRRAWGVMAIAYALLSVSGALRSLYPGDAAFPTPADLLRLAFAPVMLLGLLILPLRTRGRRERHKVWLDTVVVVVASAMLLWYQEVGPDVEQAGRQPGGALAAAIALPVLDLILIFGASVVLFRGAAESARGPAALLGLAMLVIVAGDVYLAHRQSHPGASPPDRWQFACWLTGHFTLTMAAFTQCRSASRQRIHPALSLHRSMSVLPYFAVGLCYLLLGLAVRGEQLRVLGLVVGAVVITGLVLARQVIALRQIDELAVTDPLTGLVNRSQLYDRLRLALARGRRTGDTVAALLIDVNGFKHVNDTMGHEAGDQLLVALAEILRRNVSGGDVAGRVGGDQFAIVLHHVGVPDDAAATARRIILDLRSPVLIGNLPVRPCAAIGVATSTPGQLTAEELLDDADLAMSRAKRHPTTSCFAMYQQYAGDALSVTGGNVCAAGPRAPYRRHGRSH